MTPSAAGLPPPSTLQSARTRATTEGILDASGESVGTTGPFAEALIDELPRLWRFALRLARHRADAEDLVQRTCLQALERHERYEERGQLTSWLFRICHNIWRNDLRAASVRRERRFGHVGSEADARGPVGAHERRPEDAGKGTPAEPRHSRTPERDAYLLQVLDAVEGLPEAQRDVVALVSIEGFGYRETADILDVPIGTVMSRLARARLALGRRFERAAVRRRRASS